MNFQALSLIHGFHLDIPGKYKWELKCMSGCLGKSGKVAYFSEMSEKSVSQVYSYILHFLVREDIKVS